MRKLIIWTLWLGVLAGFYQAQASVRPNGEDPFPTACVSLYGDWIAIDGERYDIRQTGCRRLTIVRYYDGEKYTVEALTDGNPRAVMSNGGYLTESYRWDSKVRANSLLILRTYSYLDKVVQEEITLERLSMHEILEKRTRLVKLKSGRVNSRVNERVLRRVQ